ncbi:hypothetical protein BVV10_17195 [Xanthomonas oryzae pv. oryzae]|nr:hypothetical protein BVV17_17190 [Xanthomonas oryzae pv. oryzae]AUJ02507.1 hypothetical protein BVV10_17195 [Xanthomonas oryzae pv. oryzae]AUJ06175.1 hypothetical protein BVV19_17220 [Xanthomonas oryzae pv. oryzae]AUJ09849.1 hypothetical protein BVV09_17190 [Xanthomonas oryzae pv. oryzae]AVU00090.1 hypothetical protein C0L89_16885 [Xanthomonas oryzae pv. oryzae]
MVVEMRLRCGQGAVKMIGRPRRRLWIFVALNAERRMVSTIMRCIAFGYLTPFGSRTETNGPLQGVVSKRGAHVVCVEVDRHRLLGAATHFTPLQPLLSALANRSVSLSKAGCARPFMKPDRLHDLRMSARVAAHWVATAGR